MSSPIRLSALALALCGGAISSDLAGQARPSTLPSGGSFAVVASRFMLDGFDSDIGLKALTLRFTTLRPNKLSLDLGAGLIVGEEAGALSLEAGPAYNVSIPGATILVRGGVTGLVGAGGGVLGGYAGVGVLFGIANGVGFRLDAARHQYTSGGESIGAWQLGAGIALLPRIR